MISAGARGRGRGPVLPGSVTLIEIERDPATRRPWEVVSTRDGIISSERHFWLAWVQIMRRALTQPNEPSAQFRLRRASIPILAKESPATDEGRATIGS